MADQMKFRVTPAQIGVARAKLTEAGFNLAGDTESSASDPQPWNQRMMGGFWGVAKLSPRSGNHWLAMGTARFPEQGPPSKKRAGHGMTFIR